MNNLSGSTRGDRWKKHLILEEVHENKNIIRLIGEVKNFLEEVFSSVSNIASTKFTAL
jgi:hypothetical protein